MPNIFTILCLGQKVDSALQGLTEKENKNKNCQEDIFGCFDEIKSAIDEIYMFELETGNVYGKGPRMFITHAKYIVAMTTKHFGRKNAKH